MIGGYSDKFKYKHAKDLRRLGVFDKKFDLYVNLRISKTAKLFVRIYPCIRPLEV